MQWQFALGVEGGGTKTEWVMMSLPGGAIVRSGSLPPANFKLISRAALERILKLLPTDVAYAGVYLAGCATELDRSQLRGVARRIWPAASVTTGGDRESGFATAFGDGDGIAVISGTGSAVTGRKDGKIEKAGGWGQLLGDTGGGYNIAVHGLRLALSCYDLGHRVTPLGEKILRALSLNRLSSLVDWAVNADKMSVARLAPVMFEAAAEGDAEMQVVIHAAANMLADYSNAVALRLELASPEVKLLGGLFLNYESYGNFFKKRLLEILPGAQVSVCRESGAVGAAWLAAHGAPGLHSPGAEPAPDADIAELAGAATEQANPRSSGLERLETREMVALFIAEEKQVAQALEAGVDPLCEAVEMVAAAIKDGDRLFYAGAGTSGRLGVLDASEIPPTFGTPPEMVQGLMAGGQEALWKSVEGAEDAAEEGAHAVIERGVKPGDVVCGITASGRTPFALGALQQARAAGARTILLTCNPSRHRADAPWDVEIDLPTGAEIVAGSTRLKAGTATKLALNIISTCAMVRLGKTRGNMMVDFAASNAKLRDRAVRMVSGARGITYAEAKSLLEKNGWRVRECLPPGAAPDVKKINPQV